MFAATAQPEPQSAWSSGTSESPNPGSRALNRPPGMSSSTAHWSKRPKASRAKSVASTTYVPARSAALRRNTNADRARNNLEPHRRRAHLLAVELDRQPLGCVDADGTRTQQIDLRVREIGALVELRSRREEVALRDVSDQHDVEQPVIGLRVGGEPHRAAVPLAVRDDHIVHPALPLGPVFELYGDVCVLPFEEDPRERVEERRAAAERLRHPVRTLGDGRAHADAADVREIALA